MTEQISYELEVNVPACKAWELYGTLKLAKLVEKESEDYEEIEIVEGDGGVGTVIHLKFPPGTPGYPGYKERFTKIDNEKRIKEAEVIEGGYLDVGFTLFRVILEIKEKGNDACIIRTAIEYQLKEEAAANASLVTIEPLAKVAQISRNFLINNKA